MDILQAARLAVMNMMGQQQRQPMGMMPGVQSGGSSTAPMGMPNARMDVMRQQMAPPVDMQGMDPEMAALMAGENERMMKQRAMYAPQTMGGR